MSARFALLLLALPFALILSGKAEAQGTACSDPSQCTAAPEMEDLRHPCEKLGGCKSFGKKKRRSGNNGFGTRASKAGASFSSGRHRSVSVFKAGSKAGSGRRGSNRWRRARR